MQTDLQIDKLQVIRSSLHGEECRSCRVHSSSSQCISTTILTPRMLSSTYDGQSSLIFNNEIPQILYKSHPKNRFPTKIRTFMFPRVCQIKSSFPLNRYRAKEGRDHTLLGSYWRLDTPKPSPKWSKTMLHPIEE